MVINSPPLYESRPEAGKKTLVILIFVKTDSTLSKKENTRTEDILNKGARRRPNVKKNSFCFDLKAVWLEMANFLIS
jgi:hypothetical protein